LLSNNLNLLVISEKYYPYGGAELAIHCILRLLRDMGFNILVITGAKNIKPLDGVEYLYSPLLNTSTKINLWKNILVGRDHFDKFIKQSDIVYIPRVAYPIIPRAKKFGKKVIVHLFDLQPIDYDAIIYHPYENYRRNLLYKISKSALYEILENQSLFRAIVSSLMTPLNSLIPIWLSYADIIVCESKRHAYMVAKEAPNLSSKIRIIYDPLPKVPLFTKVKDKCNKFLYGGGCKFSKGIHVLINASLKLIKRHIKTKFIVTRVKSTKLKSLLNNLNKKFNNPYIVLGNIEHRKFLEFHRKVVALVMPTLIEEPLPSIIIESMLAGTIPIASKTGGIPEIVRGTYAEKMLFTPGDAEELTDKMEAVLSLSEEQLINIGIKLREAILKKFDENIIKNRLLEIFTD